jgi:TfoX/Sxy family transcriptional regulator of competence genes
MPYDAALVDRVRRAVGPRRDVTERKMFGGVAFLLDGKMFVGVASDDLMVRVGPDGHAAALTRPHVRPMDFTGRPMKGYVFVGPAGCRTTRALSPWIERSLAFVATVVKQPVKKRRPPRLRSKRRVTRRP